MEFNDLSLQYQHMKSDMDRAIQKVLDHGHYIMGPEVKELEEKLADYAGTKYCLSCSSGTSALYLALRTLDLSKDDIVFVPDFTYFASGEAVDLTGGTPVFVDIDESYNINPEALEKAIERVLEEGEKNPRAVVVVDLFGLPADYTKIEAIAEKYDLFLLPDAAQSFGSSYQGRKTGSLGDVTATSFFPAKPLGCYGDGGAVFTDDEELYNLMASLRVHGKGEDKYDNVRIGINARLDTLQAAVLLTKLPYMDEERERKWEIAQAYTKGLKGAFDLPVFYDDRETALAQYTIRVKKAEDREKVLKAMEEAKIPYNIYYKKAMHRQLAYADRTWDDKDFPVSLDFTGRVLSLPMHAYLSDEEVQTVIDVLLRTQE